MSMAKRKMNVNSTINVTPMVDVMLVLLIIFMVVTPMLQRGVSVDMAQTNNPNPMPDADKEDSLLVAVMKDGKVYFGSEQTNVDDLTTKVREQLDKKSNSANKVVFIKADRYAEYGKVVQVVDNVRAAGVDQVGLLTEQRKAMTAPGAGS